MILAHGTFLSFLWSLAALRHDDFRPTLCKWLSCVGRAAYFNQVSQFCRENLKRFTHAKKMKANNNYMIVH